jgi:UDP-4-amino-4,6-dideoxy-N-acetyl-beta-L-altrosamine transaminase
MIPYGRQDINQADINAIVEVLNSNYLTQGPLVPKFENIVAEYVGADYAVAANSSTSALHIACLALGLGLGDWLWTSPNTFVASSNCALYCGAKVDFVDIDPNTYNMSIEKLTKKLSEAEKNGRLPKIVVPVHLCGQSCDMESIQELSKKYGFRIIEDASHAIGGKYKKENIGNCKFSDITVFSFHPVKIITTGEGGMALTNDSSLAEKMTRFRSHGITSEKNLMSHRDSNEIWNYQQIDLGYNYRMTDIHAALGVSQMKRIDDFVKRRREIANIYNRELSNLPILLPFQHPDNESSFHLYPIRIIENGLKITQRKVYDALQNANINVNLHYIPVYRQPYYEAMGFPAGYCPESEKYHQEALSIPIYFGLSDSQQAHVIQTIKSIFSE